MCPVRSVTYVSGRSFGPATYGIREGQLSQTTDSARVRSLGRIRSSVRTEPRPTPPLARREEFAVPARCDRACARHRREWTTM